MDASRILICAAISIAGHLVIARAFAALPDRELPLRPPSVAIEMIDIAPPPPPEPEPPPPPEPLEPPPEPVATPPPVVQQPRPRARPAMPAAKPAETDVPAEPSPSASPGAKPVYGVTMESTSQKGQVPAPVGNTQQPQPAGQAPGAVKPLGGGVAAAHEVTKMPLPQGRCAGAYTDAARAAAIEGVVVLDLVVDEAGRTRDIVVVAGLAHGLTEAAVAALRGCKFTPGERSGARVPVRIRGFKIRFLLQDGEP